MWDSGSTKIKRNRESKGTEPKSFPIFQNKFDDLTIKATIPARRFAEKAYQLVGLCLQMYPLNQRNLDNGGIYSGAGGIMLTLLRLCGCEVLRDEEEELRAVSLQQAETVLHYCKRRSDNDVVSFFYGTGGLYAICAVIYKMNGVNNKASECLGKFLHAQWLCKEVSFSITGSDDLANGRAGHIAGLIWLGNYFSNNEVRLYTLYDLYRLVHESGKLQRDKLSMSSKPSETFMDSICGSPLIYDTMGSKHLGNLMGLAGILRVYLLSPFYLDDFRNVEKDIRAGVDFFLSLQKEDGSLPDKLEYYDNNKESYESYAQWKSGAGGIGALFAAAYQRWNDEKYLNSFLLCCDFAWERGLTRNTFGLANGLAGSCYLFLLAHRITKEDVYYQRALQFTEFLISDKYLGPVMSMGHVPLKAFSLLEGIAGVALLLIDMINPLEADFPFFPLLSGVNKVS